MHELIGRFERAVRANSYRTCDDATEAEYQSAKAALTAALEVEQPVPVEIKPLEWGEPVHGAWHAVAVVGYSAFQDMGNDKYFVRVGFPAEDFLGPFDTLEAAKAAAQQEYETRIRSAIVGVAGTSIPADLVERCSEIFGWKETGMPCDPDESLKAAAHCLKAWQYGIAHGFIDNPFQPPASADLETIERVSTEAAMSQWERSLQRPDLAEKDRVRGAIEAYKRQAFAFSMAAATTGTIGGDHG